AGIIGKDPTLATGVSRIFQPSIRCRDRFAVGQGHYRPTCLIHTLGRLACRAATVECDRGNTQLAQRANFARIRYAIAVHILPDRKFCKLCIIRVEDTVARAVEADLQAFEIRYPTKLGEVILAAVTDRTVAELVPD